MSYIKEVVLAPGKSISFEINKFAKQANGSVMVRSGDTMVLVTACASQQPKEGIDYMPLQVEYRERISAAGRIPGGFFRREGRPSETEILSARLIDRPIRPMFPQGWACETQVVGLIESSDQENNPDTLAATGASVALCVSDIPFDGPVAEVRVARVNGQLIVNPTFAEVAASDMEVTVAGTEDSIVMVEGNAKEISEEDMVAALKFAQEKIAILCKAQKDIVREIGKKKRVHVKAEQPADLVAAVEAFARTRVAQTTRTVLVKDDRSLAMHTIVDETLASLAEKFPESEAKIKTIIHDMEYVEMREMILGVGKRLDGRGLTDIRSITCEVGVLPRTHGSALFTRGETQSLTTCTLGTKDDEQMIEGVIPTYNKRFMLHYNFPPFSVGEVGRMTGTGRREIGHGNLAERSLKQLLPSESEFKYTVRIVSDILESNGSSSMATVCAGSLALFDAGAPLKKSVAGIAMGLVKEGDRVAILSDILGNEDHLGDMDFKVAGTRDGITGFQMDIKIQGISFSVMERALAQAKAGRLHILQIMDDSLGAPRGEMSRFAPRLTTIVVPTDMIGAIIGPGGKTIRALEAETGATVSIEQNGEVTVAAVDGDAAEKALTFIRSLIAIPEEGGTYHGKVTSIKEGIGAIIEFMPKKEGLLHISEIDYTRVQNVSDVIQVGDEFDVKLLQVKPDGKFSLSRKALLEKPEGYVEPERRERREGSGGGRDRRSGGGGFRGRRN